MLPAPSSAGVCRLEATSAAAVPTTATGDRWPSGGRTVSSLGLLSSISSPPPPVSFASSGAWPVQSRLATPALTERVRVNGATVRCARLLGLGAGAALRWRYQRALVERARTMRLWPVVLDIAMAMVLLVPPSSSSTEDTGRVTLLTDDTFDAFIREHEFSMIEL